MLLIFNIALFLFLNGYFPPARVHKSARDIRRTGLAGGRFPMLFPTFGSSISGQQKTHLLVLESKA